MYRDINTMIIDIVVKSLSHITKDYWEKIQDHCLLLLFSTMECDRPLDHIAWPPVSASCTPYYCHREASPSVSLGKHTQYPPMWHTLTSASLYLHTGHITD